PLSLLSLHAALPIFHARRAIAHVRPDRLHGGPPIGIVCPDVRGSAQGRPNIRDPYRTSVGLGAPAVPHPEVHCHSASPMVTAAADRKSTRLNSSHLG